jgi:hypothetical protein
MSGNYRILRQAHKCQTPVEALELAEDIKALDFAAALITNVQPNSISPENRDGADKVIRGCVSLIKEMQRIAWNRLRKEFLRDISPPPQMRRRLKRT